MADSASRTLLVLGAGGHGKVVAESAQGAGWHDIRLLDDAVKPGTHVAEWAVEGPLEEALRRGAREHLAAAVALGDNALRLRWLETLEAAGIETPRIVAPSAVVSRGARIGAGSVVVAGAVVAIGAALGRGVIVNTACSIDHDCVIGDGVHVSPGVRLGGGVHVGARSWIGIGASVVHGVRIGADVIVGAGAAVIGDVPDGARVGGVPAKPLPSARD